MTEFKFLGELTL